jgi:ribulose-5-phosphate 4-epimerase/fuculose-1-phosphate aldolase
MSSLHAVTHRPGSIRDRVSPEEWQTRVDLAACYRLMPRYGMTDLIYNHITARVPGHPEHILINPYGMLYEEITASCLYKIDLEGKVVLQPNTDYGINYPGYVIHSAVHSGRHDAACVVHTHTRATMAVSTMECGLLPITQTALRFYNAVSYHDYEGPAIDLGERERLVRDLGSNDVMILRNHGTIALGRTIAQAFNSIYFLEMACRVQVDAMNSGAKLVLPAKAACEAVELAVRPTPDNPHGAADGSREWPAMRRMLDRIDPSYAD